MDHMSKLMFKGTYNQLNLDKKLKNLQMVNNLIQKKMKKTKNYQWIKLKRYQKIITMVIMMM